MALFSAFVACMTKRLPEKGLPTKHQMFLVKIESYDELDLGQ